MPLHQRMSTRGTDDTASADGHAMATRPLTFQQHVKNVFPILEWLPKYELSHLKYDIAAGITVAMVIIPQEVALANDMGVRPQYALYTAAFAPFVYALFGSSSVLSVATGPEVILLISTALYPIKSDEERLATGVFASFLVGLILLFLRFLNLSHTADFFSRPVIDAFTTAAGFLIMLSRIPVWFSIKNEHAEFPPRAVYNILSEIDKVEKNAFIVGLVSVIFLGTLRKAKMRLFSKPVNLFNEKQAAAKKLDDPEEILSPVPQGQHDGPTDISNADVQYVNMEAEQAVNGNSPAPVREPKNKAKLLLYLLGRTLCDAAAFLVFIFGGIVGRCLGPSKIELVGHVPAGLPSPTVPWYGFNEGIISDSKTGLILYHSLVIAFGIYLLAIAIAKRRALPRGEEIRTNQELLGLGIAAVVCSFTHAMPSGGDPTRSNLNAQNGKTQLASFVTSAIVIVLLHTSTSALQYLPNASLAAFIFMVGYAMVDFSQAKWLFRTRRDEFYAWLATFVLTLGLGSIYGLTASVLVSIVSLMWKKRRAPVVILGELENGNLVDRELYTEAKDLVDVVVVRVESPLHFANCGSVVAVVDEELARLAQDDAVVKAVVLDAFTMDDVDATTTQMLLDLQQKLALRKIELAVANARGKVHDSIASTELIKRLAGGDPRQPVAEAIEALRVRSPNLV